MIIVCALVDGVKRGREHGHVLLRIIYSTYETDGQRVDRSMAERNAYRKFSPERRRDIGSAHKAGTRATYVLSAFVPSG